MRRRRRRGRGFGVFVGNRGLGVCWKQGIKECVRSRIRECIGSRGIECLLETENSTTRTWPRTARGALASTPLHLHSSRQRPLVSFLFSSRSSSIVSLCPSDTCSTSLRTTLHHGAWPYCRCWGGASAPVMECPVDEGEAMMVRIPPACTGSCHPSDRPSAYPPLFYTVTGNRGNDGSFPSPAPGLYSSLL